MLSVMHWFYFYSVKKESESQWCFYKLTWGLLLDRTDVGDTELPQVIPDPDQKRRQKFAEYC
jgi:hypothetical protein